MIAKAVLFTATLVGMAGALGATQSAPGAGTHAVLELRVIASRPTGSFSPVSDKIALGSAEAGATTFYTLGSLCAVGGGRSAPENARNVWTATAVLLGARDGVYSVQLKSQRVRSAGQSGSDAPSTQSLSLRDGGTLVLDLLRDPQQANCDVSSVAIEATLKVESDDPKLNQALYAADLWFVETDAQGQAHNQHVTTNVDALSAVPFRFSDVTFPLPKIDPRQLDFSAYIRVTGTLKARARPDGLIDVDVTALRLFGLSYPGSTNVAEPRAGGMQRTVTAQENITVAIDIPQPGSGFVMAGVDGRTFDIGGGVAVGAANRTPSAKPMTPDGVPVFVNGDRFILNTSSFFKAFQTRILIRLRRVQS
jgi:hypothetical protein